MGTRTSPTALLLGGLLLLGAVLRTAYVAVTPLDLRGHDVYAHTDYIHYVTEHGRIPPAQDGWEYHQPPLYYVLAAIFAAPALRLGSTWDQIHRQLQWSSAFLSVITLLLALLIGRAVFRAPRDRPLLILYASVLATFPGLVYASSRVSNDALYQVLAFGILLLLLSWWQGGRRWQWILLSVLVGLGLLVKVSFVVFVPVILLCLWLRGKKSRVQRTLLSMAFVAIVLLLSGWLVLYRLMEADTTRYLELGNMGLDPRVVLGNHFLNYLQFNPARMLEAPFNSAYIDAGGRQYYWEYFFKSFYLGEWGFGERFVAVVRMMLLTAMSLVPVSLYGIYQTWRTRSPFFLPLFVPMALFQGASVTYRVLHTCACNQDYRFVPILIVPTVIFALRGADALPMLPRFLALAALALSALFSLLFLVALVLGGG